jgi:hypothetical protein
MRRIGTAAALAASVVMAAGIAAGEERVRGDDAETGTATLGGPTCSHEVTGTVKELDRTTGTVAIDVPGSNDIELHLSPNELAKFKEGDRVVLSMGIREARRGRGTSR